MLLNSFGGYIHMNAWQQGWVCSIFFLGGVIGAYIRRAHIPTPAPHNISRPSPHPPVTLGFTPPTPTPPTLPAHQPPHRTRHCPNSSWLNDQLGRRVPLLLAGGLVTAASLLGTTTTTFWWLLCVRCLFGIGMGINNASLAIYYAEITPKAERRAPLSPLSPKPLSSLPTPAPRTHPINAPSTPSPRSPSRHTRSGSVISRTEAFFATGGIAACFVQLAVQTRFAGDWGEPNGWRLVMGFEAVPGVVMLLGALKCVESPHWLLRRGMSVEAERVLRRIYQPTRLRDGTCDCEDRNADMTDALDTLARGLEARFFKARRCRSPQGTSALVASAFASVPVIIAGQESAAPASASPAALTLSIPSVIAAAAAAGGA